ncbi:tetraspanin-7 isoform X4 [Larimichthys crocea]|nr:tetraspanin-7 isoform X4 [Larimichthys crocea]
MVWYDQVETSVLLCALAVLGISGLGIYAGCSEKPIILKLFAGFMVGGMIGMMIIGITAAIWKNELEKEFDTDSSTVAELKKNLNELQIEESCCGFDSVSDWGDEIPDSCECEPTLHDACQAKPWGSEGPDLVYKTTCGSIVSDMLNAYTIFRGLSFGLAFTALIGLLISLLMLHQVNRHDDVRNTITYY